MNPIARNAHRTAALLLTAGVLVLIVPETHAELNLEELAAKCPSAKILAEVAFEAPLTARDLRQLRKLELNPITPNKDALIGRDTLPFAARASNALRLRKEDRVTAVKWIKRYPVAAHYRIYFEYVGEKTAPRLTFTVATPRSAPGRTLRSLESFVWPKTEFTTTRDEADNQFLTAKLTDVEPGRKVLFDFYAAYAYDTETIIEKSMVMLGPTPMPETWPEKMQPFLKPGFHIESDAGPITGLAERLKVGNRLDASAHAVLRHVGRRVEFDHDKRERYFGGRFTYGNSWEMWQGAVGTLDRGVGCCPDTAELKTALLRAMGIPARTAVHTGHLYAEFYVPGAGWLTDAPMYNVPLVRSPGPDNRTYFEWKPELPVRCVEWECDIQPFGQLRPGMRVDHPLAPLGSHHGN